MCANLRHAADIAGGDSLRTGAQDVTRLALANLRLVEIPEGELCCGSAGTYNLEQPALAAQIGERKARNIRATGAQAVAAGNIGCIMQIRNHLAALGAPLPVWHTVEVLDMAYRAATM